MDLSVKVLAAIPAFDEEKTIGSVVLMARRHANEVLVVDDGSEDATAWVAEQAGATVIRHRRNEGYGAAIRSCFDYARKIGATVLVVLDGDGQHRADLIPRVVAPILSEEGDVCIGSRFLDAKSASKVPGYRRFGIGILTRLTNLGRRPGSTLTDGQSGFRAYSRAAVERIKPVESDMGASAEILWEADRRGLRIVEVPIEVDYDAEDPARRPIAHGLSVIMSMVRYVETQHALLFFGVPGITLFTLGLATGFYVVQVYTKTTVLAVGLALITVLFLTLGLLLGFTGLILHAVINATKRSQRN